MNRSLLKCFATRMTHPFLKLMCSVLFVMKGVFFACNYRSISLLGPHLSMTSMARAIKLELKNSRNYLTNHALVIYGLRDICTHMHAYPHESDFKKPRAWLKITSVCVCVCVCVLCRKYLQAVRKARQFICS